MLTAAQPRRRWTKFELNHELVDLRTMQLMKNRLTGKRKQADE